MFFFTMSSSVKPLHLIHVYLNPLLCIKKPLYWPINNTKQVINEALVANKPSIVSKLVLHHCELGNQPIRIEALRVVQLNNNSTNLLILDVDVRWVSNMQVRLARPGDLRHGLMQLAIYDTDSLWFTYNTDPNLIDTRSYTQCNLYSSL